MAGHSFDQNVIQGGRVHFGNVYYNDKVEDARGFLQTNERQYPPTKEKDSSDLHELYIVPRSSRPQFVGRHLLAKMVKENLTTAAKPDGRGKHRIAVLYGLGGSGKTQFCLKYAETQRYWGVFWIDASTRENAEISFAVIGEQAGKASTFVAGKYWLSQSTKPWLLILDNADDLDLDISELIPPGDKGNVLITTRNPNVEIYATAGTFRLQGMDPEEALILLLKSAYPNDPTDDAGSKKRTLAQTIAAELGYLAIALDHAGATIRRRIYTLEKYLHFYLGYRHRLLSSSKSITEDESNVIATWEIPFRRIETRESVQFKDAVALMHIFAFLHFESISEHMFYASWSSSEDVSGLKVILPDILKLNLSRSEEAKERLRRAISVLSDYSIIDHDADRGICSLHPVIHRWARTRISDEARLISWLDCTISLLVRCISPNLEASGRHFRRDLLPHIDSCLQMLEAYSPSFPQTKERADEVERFAWVYEETGKWKSALALQNKIIKYRRESLGKTHEATLRAQRSLSHVYWNLFDVKSAIDIQRQILEARWRSRPSIASWLSLWKPDHVGYCAALNDLTQTLWLAGRRDLSRRCGEYAVKGLLKRLGPDDPLTLDAMFNLARTYFHVGDVEKAVNLLLPVLLKRKRFFGHNHPDTLMARNELGMCFCAYRERLAAAERLVTNVYEARKRVLGEEHAYTLWSANDLSKVLCERGRPSEAVRMLEAMKPVVERTLGGDHVGMNMTNGNLARAYVLCERWDDAERVLLQMLSVIKEDHPDWIHSMSGCIHVQIHLDKLVEAESRCKTVLQMTSEKKISHRDNPWILAVVKQLAQIYSSTGRLDLVPILEAQYPVVNDLEVKIPFARSLFRKVSGRT